MAEERKQRPGLEIGDVLLNAHRILREDLVSLRTEVEYEEKELLTALNAITAADWGPAAASSAEER